MADGEPRRRAEKKVGAARSGSRSRAAKREKITRRNEKRSARNADKPGQGSAGTAHIDSPYERDRGPAGVKGRSAPGQSRPGRR